MLFGGHQFINRLEVNLSVSFIVRSNLKKIEVSMLTISQSKLMDIILKNESIRS